MWRERENVSKRMKLISVRISIGPGLDGEKERGREEREEHSGMQVEKHETGKEIYRVNVHVACLMGGSSELLHWESLFNWLCVSHGERERRERRH